MRAVPLNQEVNPLHVAPILKAAKELLEGVAGKDTGAAFMSAWEDTDGRRWVRIAVEVG